MINRMIWSFLLSFLIIAAILTRGEFTGNHDDEIDRFLKKINKPALKSIKSPDGGIIDCVHMKNHPIYDHPLFKKHTIQMRPSSYPEEWNNESSDTKNQSLLLTQRWTINGKCPKNSIPIRRTKREDILRAGSIERYVNKYPNNVPRPKPANLTNDDDLHEYALIAVKGKFRGAEGTINVWKPYIQTPKEFSLAQMWIMAGPEAEINTIEFGWQAYPDRYHDDKPRYFIYWTANAYNNSGCYNLDCPGFVHVNQEFALGEPVSHVSTRDGEQYDIPTRIWKDHHSGNWWLQLGYNLIIGYWPSLLFNHLRDGATEIHWGGEVINFKDDSQHTTTNMGSGSFAWEGYAKSSYFRNLRIYDECNTWKPIEGGYSYMTKESCYNVRSAYEMS